MNEKLEQKIKFLVDNMMVDSTNVEINQLYIETEKGKILTEDDVKSIEFEFEDNLEAVNDA